MQHQRAPIETAPTKSQLFRILVPASPDPYASKSAADYWSQAFIWAVNAVNEQILTRRDIVIQWENRTLGTKCK